MEKWASPPGGPSRARGEEGRESQAGGDGKKNITSQVGGEEARQEKREKPGQEVTEKNPSTARGARRSQGEARRSQLARRELKPS